MGALPQEMMQIMPRNINKHPSSQALSCSLASIGEEKNWLVVYQNQHACLHHVHTSPDDHLLCGPLVFCCQNAINRFLELAPNFDCLDASYSGLKDQEFEIKLTPAGQIITWMDAGVQIINFIICDNTENDDLTAASLSGNQARQALKGEIPLQTYGSSSSLSTILCSYNKS